MDLQTERQLVKKAQSDPEAFGQLYDEYYQKIFGYILRRTADPEIAQDITSETFAKALAKLWQWHWRNISFSSWLYKIATNEINYYFRKHKYKTILLDKLLEEGKLEPITLRSPESAVIEAYEQLARHQEFMRCRAKASELSAKYQEVIALRFFERKSIKEISEILGKSEGTIKSLLHRGLKKIRLLVAEETSSENCNQLSSEAL